jgi:restriction endonuclease S subunit
MQQSQLNLKDLPHIVINLPLEEQQRIVEKSMN